MLGSFQQIWRSKFARNVAIVASGTAGAQIIGILFSPIITRMYGPEAFGILGTYIALLTILTPLAALSYPVAIVLPKHDSDAVGLIKLSLKLGLVTSGLAAIILLFAQEQLLDMLNIAQMGSFIWFVPVAMFLSVCLAVVTQWIVRKKLFKLKAQVAVISALLQNGLKSILGLFAPFAWILILVATMGSALNAALLYLGVRKENAKVISASQKRTNQIGLAKMYGDFVYFRTPQIMLNSASQSMPVLMLTALFGPAIAGFYAIGITVLSAPTKLIGQSIQTVFYPHFNETILKGLSGTKVLVKAIIVLAIIGLIPFGIIIIFGPWLFLFVFGNEWAVAGEFASWLALWTYASFINRPSIAAIPVLKLQGFFLIYEIVSTAVRASALYIAYVIYETAISAVIMFSLANVCLYFTLTFVTVGLSRRNERE